MEAKQVVTTWQTCGGRTDTRILQPEPDISAREGQLLNLYPEVGYQKLGTFGGAITDAAAATLEQYAIPALLRAAGRREESCIPARTVCTLTNGFSKPSKGNRYLRATFCGGKVTLPGAGNAEVHSSGALSAMMGCNCLVEIPAGSGPVEPGMEVEVLCFVQ